MSDCTKPKCVLCDNEAVTTAAQFLVCAAHHRAYSDEARRDLPHYQRTVWLTLIATTDVMPLDVQIEESPISTEFNQRYGWRIG